MENKKESMDEYDYIEELVKPIFDEVPKETRKNHVSVGGRYDYSFLNLHNARFYFDFDKSKFKPTGRGVGFRIINNRELCLSSWLSCRIVVKKSMIEVTNQINTKRLFKIEGSADERKHQVIDAVVTLEKEAISVLRKFISVFGGSSSLIVKNAWIPDNKITHDELIDSLPMRMTFRNEVAKKVYKEPPNAVECADPAYVSYTFRNLGLRDYCPEIAEAIESQADTLKDIREGLALKNVNVLEVLKSKIKSFPDDVLKNAKLVTTLSQAEKDSFLDWVFEQFGVRA